MANTQNIISLCAGVGMLDEGCHAGLGYLGIESRTVAYVEWESYAASQLVALMESECLDAAPVWCGDLAGFPFTDFRGLVHGIIAGFPCQPHSVAGKRAGLDDDRWIWPAIMQGIRDSGAEWVFLENVPGLATTGGLAECLKDLAENGMSAEWGTLRASDVGASHQRERIFILAVRAGRGFGELRESSGGDGFADRGESQLDDTMLGRHGNANQEIRTGRYGAVNASNANMENPSRHGGDRPHGEDRRGRGVCETGGAMGDPENDQRWRELEARGTGSRRAGLAGTSDDMADASRTGPQGSEFSGTRISHRGGQETHGSVSELCGTFAPGPSDPRWAGIIERFPYLAPATQSGVCQLVDGQSLLVDESRRNQLRCVGNGVVATQAAAAFVQLARRLK